MGRSCWVLALVGEQQMATAAAAAPDQCSACLAAAMEGKAAPTVRLSSHLVRGVSPF